MDRASRYGVCSHQGCTKDALVMKAVVEGGHPQTTHCSMVNRGVVAVSVGIVEEGHHRQNVSCQNVA